MLIFYCINAVSIDGTWYDWKTIVDEVRAGNQYAALVEFDNMNIKACFNTVDGVKEAHQFTATQSFMGEEAVICDDCGDTLIIIK